MQSLKSLAHPLAGLFALSVSATSYSMSDTPPPPPPDNGALTQPGPGLGNISYNSNELFKPVSWINRDNGVPPTRAFRKAFGINVGIMIDGYFLAPFAPDSGLGPGGFLLFDVSDPRNIKNVKRIYEPDGRTSEFREVHAIGMAKMNNRRYISIHTTQGIEIWDFTDLNNPQQTSKLNLPGVNAGDYTSVAWQLWWQAPYLYVAGSNQGVFIVDTSDPANPVIANRGNGRPNPVPPAELGGTRVGPIFTMGNQLLVTSMDQQDGWSSLDISDPLNPVLLDRTPDLAQTYYATCFDGTKVHASTRGGGARMVSYDLSDPARFVFENNQIVLDEQLYCGVQDNYVFQGLQNAVYKVDVTNPFSYQNLGGGSLGVSNPDHGQVAPLGNLVFIGNDHGTGSAFMVHDVNPDTKAPWVKQVSPRPDANNQALTSRIGIAFSDTVDYESVNENTLKIIDLSSGSQISGTYSAQLGIVNFSPAQPLKANTQYEIRVLVDGVKDSVGNATDIAYSSRFTTGSAAAASLTYHWPLDVDGRELKSGNQGQNQGGTFAEGGLVFDSNGDQLALATDVSGVLGGSATVSFYLKTTQTGTAEAWYAPGLFGRDDNNGTNDVFWGWLDDQGRMRVSAANDGGIATPAAVNDGQWHHYVMTRNSADGALTIWQDGQRVATGSARSGVFGGASYNEYQTLGRILHKGKTLQGNLDDVRVYNRVLNNAEIAELFAAPVASISAATQNQQQLVGEDGQFRVDLKNARYQGGAAQVSWNFGDGTVSDFSTQTSHSHTLTHRYSQPGHYRVIVTIRTDAGEQTLSFEHTVSYPLTRTAPAASGPIVADANQVYNVNPDNGTVTAINRNTMNKAWEVAVGKDPKTLAVGPDGLIWVAVQADDLLVAVNSSGNITKRIELAYGSGPYGITFTPDGLKGLVTLQNAGELLVFDPANGNELNRLAVNREPRGIAVDSDSGLAYISQFRTSMSLENGDANTTGGAEITLVDLPTMTIDQRIRLANDTTTVDAEDRARGVPNYLNQIVISPDGRRAWLPTTKVNINRGVARDGKALTHETSVRTVVNQIDLISKQERFDDQIDFNDRDSAHAMAFSPAGDYAFVALQGSNNVEIVDAYSGAVRGALDNSGLAPQGVYIDALNQRAYVYNFTSRSVSIFDIKDTLASVSFAPEKIRTVNVVANETLDANVLRGKQVFYNARDTRMSRDGYMACASCHLEGLDDGMVWDFTDRGEGLRNTISLKGRMGDKHGNVHWTANFDEIHDFENDIRFGFGGTGFMANADFEATKNPLGAPKKGKSADLDALVAYVSSLEDYERSPFKTANGKLTAAAQAGEALFNSTGCAGCHSGEVNGINTKRDGARHDVGTIQANSGQGISQPLAGVGFDTPTLHGVWRTAPYFHNGQQPTLEGVVASGHGGASALNAQQQSQLVAYVKSLDGEDKRYFRVKMRDWDECLVAEGSGPDANIGRYNCGSWNDQWWYGDISGRLHSKRDESYCAKGQARDGGWLSVWKCNNNSDQQWDINNFHFRLKQNTNFVMDAHQSQKRQVTMYSNNGQNNQFWLKNFSDFNHLKNANGLCLTATAVSREANVVLENCRNSDLQQWWRDGEGRYHLLRDPNFCLDYKGETNNNGALVVWECNNDWNQYFVLEGKTIRTRRDNNFAVDAFGSTPGSNVGIWSVNGGANQNWTVE